MGKIIFKNAKLVFGHAAQGIQSADIVSNAEYLLVLVCFVAQDEAFYCSLNRVIINR